MSGQEWIELLNLIPEDQHSALNVMCRSGVELSIDAIMRAERSFLVYRGRMVGTTDEGRIFFTPYSEITSLYLNRYCKENEVNDMFDFDGVGLANAAESNQASEDGSGIMATPQAVIPPPPPAPAPFPLPASVKSSGLIPRIPAAAPKPFPPPSVTTATPVTTKAPSFMPPPPSVAIAESTTKGSILDRLRAQRNVAPARK